MALKDDLTEYVAKVFRETWTERDGQVVPEVKDLGLGNDAVKLTATVLYADISGSTALVDRQSPHRAAEIYKSFLGSAAKIIKAFGGIITAYDGDRIMAVYIGGSKNTNATKSGLKINFAAKQIVQPALNKQYPDNTFTLKHVVGIDSSALFVSRIGVRVDNDLVWVGRAANHAAKLTELSPDFPTYITDTIYNNVNDEAKLSNGVDMWKRLSWTAMSNRTIYGSTYWWSI
jgi:class 3 adenylate cyclase